MRLREGSARTTPASETSGKTPKTRAARIAWEVIGFAVEWAIAFAIAKRLANAFAQNANAIADLDADAFEHIQALDDRLDDYRRRLTRLEDSHSFSGSHEDDQPWSGTLNNGQPPPRMVPKGRQGRLPPTRLDYPQPFRPPGR